MVGTRHRLTNGRPFARSSRSQDYPHVSAALQLITGRHVPLVVDARRALHLRSRLARVAPNSLGEFLAGVATPHLLKRDDVRRIPNVVLEAVVRVLRDVDLVRDLGHL